MWHHLGAWWVKEAQWRESLGNVLTLEMLVQGTQFLQAEGVRYAIEAARRRKYQNSGTLPWQFNEPFPMAACTSAVDYYGQPKPLYYAVARAYESVLLTAQFASQTWVHQATFEARIILIDGHRIMVNAPVLIRLVGASGKVYAEQVNHVPSPSTDIAYIADFSYPLADVEDIFFLDLEIYAWEQHRSRYLFTRAENLAPALAMPPTSLKSSYYYPQKPASAAMENTSWLQVTNSGVYTAMYVWLDGANEDIAASIYFSRNYFCLVPGETRLVLVDWQNVPEERRHLTIKGWNTDPIHV